MRSRVFALGLVMVACSGAEAPPGVAGLPSSSPAFATIPRADVERDLALELTRKTSETFDEERDPRFEVWLVNRSQVTAYPIVLSNDGSESGWREPTVSLAMERQSSNGAWEAVPKSQGGRCGLYAVDWTLDVKTLAPGARVKLDWFPFWRGEGDATADAKRVRFTAHYAYGEHARDQSKVPTVLHAMPEYAIASAPFEIEVAAPLRLELKVKGPLPAVEGALVSSVFDVTMVNQSGAAQRFDRFENGHLSFESDVVRADGTRFFKNNLELDAGITARSKDVLSPGGRHALVAAQMKTSSEWTLEPGARIARVRAVWRAWEQVDGEQNVLMRRAVSAWLPLPEKR